MTISTPWYKWFAWYPVRTREGDIAWMITVNRRDNEDLGGTWTDIQRLDGECKFLRAFKAVLKALMLVAGIAYCVLVLVWVFVYQHLPMSANVFMALSVLFVTVGSIANLLYQADDGST